MRLTFSCEHGQINIAFREVRLTFEDSVYQNVFSCKNNKSVAQTLLHKRYQNLASRVNQGYSQSLQMPIGTFLLKLKNQGDAFYKEFLNDCGDLEYCRFCIGDKEWLKRRGIYIYAVGNKIRYVGRCLDSFEKRVNSGYGRISPKNCFIDGQKTNCHLNNLILKNKGSVQLYASEITNTDEIKKLERCMIKECDPLWNIALRRGKN